MRRSSRYRLGSGVVLVCLVHSSVRLITGAGIGSKCSGRLAGVLRSKSVEPLEVDPAVIRCRLCGC